ncbi:hypothetical protein [uncultured Desulfovibrio sp.]|uniref:hypothetical protein n=1 Tax=uncultured Desulfovibrio sp. TaxID=167968 RepID=UPI002628B64A|nr:hypothetical protein [uncultured Desulfovibrio sp.]
MNGPWLLILLLSELPVAFLLALGAAGRARWCGAGRTAALVAAVLTPLLAEGLRHVLLRSGQYLFVVHPVLVLAAMLAGGLAGWAVGGRLRAERLLPALDALGFFLLTALLVHSGLASGLYEAQIGLCLLAWLIAGLTSLLRDMLLGDASRLMEEQVYATGMALAALLLLAARLHWPALCLADQLGLVWACALIPLLLREAIRSRRTARH